MEVSEVKVDGIPSRPSPLKDRPKEGANAFVDPVTAREIILAPVEALGTQAWEICEDNAPLIQSFPPVVELRLQNNEVCLSEDPRLLTRTMGNPVVRGYLSSFLLVVCFGGAQGNPIRYLDQAALHSEFTEWLVRIQQALLRLA